ncbi:glycosyltransferase family 2 protein [Neisseria perflava]|uniref:glycosyltransferase family 2 protein n=1 Tax=Neisseria perflava TaxID=33053 RepID=UPI0020A1E35D|nr:glycosyltransferase family 2 protein [Neisseria perflava]MCP1661140.1 glycosyltransferase involved in cell wall biosynthesis [Neisseria perflava]MCP1772813.1 glycosyltransferase involved in cell wall biosynthesis [Neisseria perflava]
MKLSLVVPVFNEEDTIPAFYQAVRTFDYFQDKQVEIIFINDGSRDNTEAMLNMIALSDPLVTPLHFTRNFGKEATLFAGLEHASGEAAIPMDVDLQDPLKVIPQMVEKWQNGADMVLAKRIDRSEDHCFKR